MRSSQPRFGRKRPLTDSDFADFESAFHKRPKTDEVSSGRWRVYSREEIATRDDNLNLTWLQSDPNSEYPEVTDPVHVLSLMTDQLRNALEEAELLAEELSSIISVEAEA